MNLSVNGKIEKINPLPVEVRKAIDSDEKYNSTISLYKKDNEYLDSILSYSGGYQLKYNNEEGSFKTHLICIDEEEVKKVFNGYYFDDLDWKNHFKWEGETLFNLIKSLFLGILALAFFIYYAANGFNRNVAIDKIFNFFDSVSAMRSGGLRSTSFRLPISLVLAPAFILALSPALRIANVMGSFSLVFIFCRSLTLKNYSYKLELFLFASSG